MRLISFITVLIGALAMAGEYWKLEFPTARWFFRVSREVPLLNSGGISPIPFGKIGWPSAEKWLRDFQADAIPWFGWGASGILILLGLWLFFSTFRRGPKNPVTVRRIQRFREIKRGYYSLIIIAALAFLAMLDQAVVGKRALAVKYDGKWIYPAFSQREYKNKDFGETSGDRAEALADYRSLKRKSADDKTIRVIMPLIPFDPTGDTLPPRSRPMIVRDGLFFESGSRSPFSGLVARYYDADEGRMHVRYTMREGVLSGAFDGYDAENVAVYSGEYLAGEVASERYSGSTSKEDFLAATRMDLRAVKYHPAPPLPEEGNLLGTTSQGYDMLAYLYGGLQVNFKAALIYLPVIYLIGITIGLLMGFFGGWFDLVVQRIIEVLSNMPFLFVVIIFSSVVPDRYKGLPVILTILIAFGWMGLTYLMRTAAYRDRERDYIAAARTLGASTPRILIRHLLPNTLAIIVTLVPFTMSGLVFALTSLDYLGFGLPPEYATWGRLLSDGLNNFSAPWMITTSCFVLVALLVLITFIGEAVREAFDPKKFTYYR